jgi:3-oxoadipate enol-lactonase
MSPVSASVHTQGLMAPERRAFGARAFVLLVTYTAPLPRIDELLEDHRAWLDRHFADGTFLVSGPQVPRVGGTILANAGTRRELEDLVTTDPLVRAGAAEYDVVEFSPTRGPYAASARPSPPGSSTLPEPATLELSDHTTAIIDRPPRGGEDAPPVVLVHALGLDRLMWRAVIDLLPTDRRVLAYDLRGHGTAGLAPTVRGLAHWSDDLLDVLDATGIERAHVVGLSLGGAIAQVFALAHPERVHRLDLVATVSTPRPAFVERGRTAIEQGMGAVLPATLARWFTAQALATNGPSVRYARGMVRRSDPTVWAASWRALAEVDTQRNLRHLRVPTRVIAGEHDASTPPATMALIARAVPGATFHVIPGAPHMISLETPAPLARLLP